MAEKIEAARLLLKSSLEKSKQVSSALNETGSRLREINQRIPSLEAEIRPVLMHRSTYVTVRNQIDCVIGPVGAVLRVYEAVRELERLLSFSDPSIDIFGYVSATKRLEQGLKFLSSNCSLAIQWLEETLQLLESNAGFGAAKDRCFLELKKSLSILEMLRDMEGNSRFEGGLISEALDKLEGEFKRLLIDNTHLIPVDSEAAWASTTPLMLPVSVIRKLQIMIERLEANDRLKNCISWFIEFRALNARTSLQALDLDYLDVQVTKNDDIKSVESYIKQWGKHLEVAIKCVFAHEYKLCCLVFEKVGSDKVCTDCFAKIATAAGILSFLRFGKEVTNIKKDPIKLVKLLDVFKVMNSLRLDFSLIFGNEACSEIQAMTRDLVKKLVEGACGIFWELPAQVAQQRLFSSPPDGSVPRLVRFVTEYSNQLLGEDYIPALTEVLTIDKKWKQEVCEEGLLSGQFHSIMKELGLNLDEWSKAYADTSLSYLFMMNNHCHFRNLRGTKLGDIMGDSWLRAHEQYKDYYAALYLKESWGKILPLLSQKGLVVISSLGNTETGQDWNKKRLKAFNEAFEERYEKHSKWVITDESLRQNVCQLLVQTVVPTYRNYIRSYKALAEQDASAGKYVKHTAQSLENKLSSMFQPKLIKFCSNNHARIVGRIKNVVANRIRATLAAV